MRVERREERVAPQHADLRKVVQDVEGAAALERGAFVVLRLELSLGSAGILLHPLHERGLR